MAPEKNPSIEGSEGAPQTLGRIQLVGRAVRVAAEQEINAAARHHPAAEGTIPDAEHAPLAPPPVPEDARADGEAASIPDLSHLLDSDDPKGTPLPEPATVVEAIGAAPAAGVGRVAGPRRLPKTSGVYDVAAVVRGAPPGGGAKTEGTGDGPERPRRGRRARRAPRRTGRARAQDTLRERIEEMYGRLSRMNHFEVLGVPTDATAEAIRDAYFALARQFHPDTVASRGLSSLRPEAEEIFRAVNLAHRILADDARRAEYLESLEAGGEQGSSADAAVRAEFEFQKGLVLFRRKKFRQAVRHFRDALKANPAEGAHRAWVAWTIYSDPRTDRPALLPELREQLEEAVRTTPSSVDAHYFLGEILLAMGDDEKAHTHFARVLEIDPQHIDAGRRMRLYKLRAERADKRGRRAPRDPADGAADARGAARAERPAYRPWAKPSARRGDSGEGPGMLRRLLRRGWRKGK